LAVAVHILGKVAPDDLPAMVFQVFVRRRVVFCAPRGRIFEVFKLGSLKSKLEFSWFLR